VTERARLPIKRVAEVKLGKMLQSNPSTPEARLAPYLRAAHIQPGGRIVRASDQQMWFTKRELREHDLRQGDVVVVEGGAVGRSAYLADPMPGWGFQNSIVRVRPRHGLALGRFIAYALQAALSRGEIDALCSTATIPHFTAEKVAALTVPAPSVGQQAAIADFLDRETARIDTLIAKQEKLIETLGERRRSVVEVGVFRGVARNDNLFDSGFKWLPHVPADWPVTQLGFVSETLPGFAFPAEKFSSDTSHVKLLRGINIKPGALDWSETVYWESASERTTRTYGLEAGDLVVGMDRPFVTEGVRVARVSDTDLPALLLQRVLRIRSRAGVSNRFLAYVLGTRAFHLYLEPLFTGVSVPHASEWQIRKFRFPLPPPDTQREIVEYLDENLEAIDSLIRRAHRFIDLVRERRAALITAAVTGQIDVTEKVNVG
jgi:type I restriction enzyme S subunit